MSNPRFLVLLASFVAATSAFASCPDISGEFSGRCDETTCGRPARTVEYRRSFQQNGCDSLKMGGATYSTAVDYKIGETHVLPGVGANINTLAVYFKESLHLVETFTKDQETKPFMTSVTIFTKGFDRGGGYLDVNMEMSGFACGKSTMVCRLNQVSP